MDELNRFILRVKDADGNWIDLPGLRGLQGEQGTPGEDGEDGTDGTDGVSPAVTISSITDGHRVKITDKDHPQGQTFDVMNGAKGDTGNPGTAGEPGEDGVSPTITITDITGGHRVTITDAEHPLGQSFDVLDGEDGASDAGEVTYDPEETYDAGTVGAALNTQSSQIANLEALGLTVVNGEINIIFDAEGETA